MASPAQKTSIHSMHSFRLGVIATGAILAIALAASPVGGAAPPLTVRHAAGLGTWTRLGAAQGSTTATLLRLSSGKDLVVWEAPVSNSVYRYDYSELKANGAVATPATEVFSGQDWKGLGESPVLVSSGDKPTLIFDGSRGSSGPYANGCIVGDVLGPSGWSLQSWSLSADCANPAHFGATADSNGSLSAAWAGGWANGHGMLYRLSASPTIPASTPDQHISTNVGDAGNAAETTESKSHDVYAAWTRFFSAPASKDGLYASDLTTGSFPLKAPGTGTLTVASYPEPVAMAAPSHRTGIYLAYCNNASPCTHVDLWKLGSTSAVTVPKAVHPRSVALSAGPEGRLWIAWWSATDGKVGVVRTNKAGTSFGPVRIYAGPAGCTGDGIGTISLSRGSSQRLDVAVGCYDYTAQKPADDVYTTQTIVPLQISETTSAIKSKKGGKVVYRVADVGDPVHGATVSVEGKKGATDKKGQITFHFPKGAKKGTYKVVAKMANYLKAKAALTIS